MFTNLFYITFKYLLLIIFSADHCENLEKQIIPYKRKSCNKLVNYVSYYKDVMK